MAKQSSTLITLILDRSGSMISVCDATIEGVNAFVKQQKETPGECRMTLVQFDNQYEVHYKNRPIVEVSDLNRDTYQPRGGTALLDAIGRTIDDLGKELAALVESERPDKVIVVIQTDGQENSSTLYDRKAVFDRITHQRNVYNWEFVFLAANQDAIAEAAKFGIAAGTSLGYGYNATGTASAFNLVAQNISASRVSGGGLRSFSSEERTEAKAGDVNVVVPTTQTTHSAPNVVVSPSLTPDSK